MHASVLARKASHVPPAHDATPVRARQCACGGIAGQATECPQCRANHLSGRAAGAAHSFGTVSVLAPVSGERCGGADLRGQDAGVAVPADAGKAPAEAGKAPAAAATLTKSEVTPRTDDTCGGFHWAIKWGLSNATDKTNGFIVQQLTFDLKREKCAGGRNDYWEVRGGKIFVGTSKSEHRADTFRVPATPSQKGVNREEGKAKFMPDYKAPASWGKIPEAGSLPATETEPAGWTDAGNIDRDIISTFDCCGKTPTSKVEGTG